MQQVQIQIADIVEMHLVLLETERRVPLVKQIVEHVWYLLVLVAEEAEEEMEEVLINPLKRSP
jgi:uncharacterized protein YwlG (UPF0340 family)